jgi:hypothetical protein
MGSVPFWNTPTQGLASAASLPPGGTGETYSSNRWGTGWIAGLQIPGVVEVRGKSVTGIEIDTAKAKGRDGTRITIQGYKAGEFDIIALIWTDEQWEKIQDVKNTILVKPQKKSKVADAALAVYHPALAFVNISSAVLLGINPPEDGSEIGTKIIRFRMYENAPAGKKKTTKTAKSTAVGRIKEYRPGEAPKNSGAVLPSADKKNMSPHGQPTAPAGGST